MANYGSPTPTSGIGQVAAHMPFEEQMKGGKWRPGEPHYWVTGNPGNRRKRPENM